MSATKTNERTTMENETTGALVPVNAIEVFERDNGIEAVIAKIREAVMSEATDVTTADGRKRIASLAFKVARSKVALDDAGKSLGENYRRGLERINEDRRKIRDELDTLKSEVRQPLDEYESRESRRIAVHQEGLEIYRNHMAAVAGLQTASEADAAIKAVPPPEGRNWEEYSDKVRKLHTEVMDALKDKLVTLQKAEAERAELEKLRKEKEERERKEREETIAREAAGRAKREAEELAAREKAEIVRKAAEAEAKAKAKQAAELAGIEAAHRAEREKALAEARAAKAREEQAAKEKADAEARHKRELAEAEAKAKAEAEKKERARIEAEAKAKAEAERKAANEAHRNRIKKAAFASLMSATNLDADTTKAVLSAIDQGRVKHVAINY